MITIPIDEMLSDLRSKLELLEREPSYAAIDEIYRETNRICDTCDMFVEE